MRYDDDHKAKTRAKVLRAAARAIRAEGPERVGVAQVMAEAGLTHGGFYAHFASKDELVGEAIRQMFAEGAERYDRVVAGKSAAEALGAYIDSYVSRRHRDARDTGCPLPALSGDLPRLPEAARARFGEGFQQLRNRLAGWLIELDKPDPQGLAASVLAEMVGVVALSRAVPDGAESDRILKTTRAALKSRLGLDQTA